MKRSNMPIMRSDAQIAQEMGLPVHEVTTNRLSAMEKIRSIMSTRGLIPFEDDASLTEWYFKNIDTINDN